MAFSDVGKAFKDCSSGFVYEHKASFVGAKVAGYNVAGSSTYKFDKGDHTFPSELRAGCKLADGVSLEAQATDKGKLLLTASKDGLAPGLKATVVSTLLVPQPSAKLSLVYAVANAPAGGKSVIKADATLGSTKVLASAGWARGTVLAGGEAEMDAAAGSVGRYSFGGQASVFNASGVAALVVTDKSDTLRGSYTHKCSASVTAGVEVVHRVNAGTTTGTVAAAKKFTTATGKATLSNAGILSVLYSVDLQPKTGAVFAMQMDTNDFAKPPKVCVHVCPLSQSKSLLFFLSAVWCAGRVPSLINSATAALKRF